jgi:hypothetical protein
MGYDYCKKCRSYEIHLYRDGLCKECADAERERERGGSRGKKKPKITFGKMESVSGIWDDTQEARVYLDGEDEGFITKEWQPETMWGRYRIDSYDVLVSGFDAEGEPVELDKSFAPDDYNGARYALSAAKKWAREMLTIYAKSRVA